MTIQEAKNTLPHDFSGSSIVAISFDAVQRSMVVEIHVLLGFIADRFEQTDVCRPGVLRFTGVDQFAADKHHGKALPIAWKMRSLEATEDNGSLNEDGTKLTVFTMQLGFKEQFLIVAQAGTFDWTGSEGERRT